MTGAADTPQPLRTIAQSGYEQPTDGGAATLGVFALAGASLGRKLAEANR